MALFHGVVETCLVVVCVGFAQDLVLVAFILAEVLDHPAGVTSFTEVEKGAYFTHALRRR